MTQLLITVYICTMLQGTLYSLGSEERTVLHTNVNPFIQQNYKSKFLREYMFLLSTDSDILYIHIVFIYI